MNKQKKVNVMWNGKKMCQIYPHATKWEVFKFKVKRFFRKCLIAVILVAVVYGIFMAGKFVNPIVKYQIQEKEVILDNLSEKINELKGKLVDDIRKCESAGYSEDDGIIIFDSNNKASIGNYQFQKKTVIYYAKMFYGKDLTGKEAVLLALDEKKAGELASKVIFESENGLDNWLNCSKKVGAYAQLKVIKELEK